MHRRGFGSWPDAKTFFESSPSLLEDPSTLPDIDRAVARIQSARLAGECVAVYGDFDADGVTGTALLTLALRRFGISAEAYIPHRVYEGHGLNSTAIDKLANRGVTLILTVDCGVTNVEEIDYASSRGIDTIVTDHHVAPPEIPTAVAVINPHAPHSHYGFSHLTGVGMAFKLSQMLLEPYWGSGWDDRLAELAAIGTITDMAPLLGENRYIVANGLAKLKRTTSPGLIALLDAGRVEPDQVDADTVGFTIGPRLNAAGRLGHAQKALDLLLTESSEDAQLLVAQLNETNKERQTLTDDTLKQARDLVDGSGYPMVFVGSSDFNPGIVGLVAGRLAEELGVPAVVYSEDSGLIRASCRSAPGFHWADSLETCSDLLDRFGGHAQAAGFSCRSDLLPTLRSRLMAIADERLAGQPLSTHGVIDAIVDLDELMGDCFLWLRKMEPYGIGNPAPLFFSKGLTVEKAWPMGVAKNHFRLRIKDRGVFWEAIAFRQEWIEGTTKVDLVFKLEVDHWNGQDRVRLNIQDFCPSIATVQSSFDF